MEQKALSRWLRLVVVGVGLCGLVVYGLILPIYGQSLADSYPEFANRFWPWLIFLWATGIPCYFALGFGWKITEQIRLDRSFSMENARYLKWIAWLAAGDSVVFFAVNVLYLLADLSHPGVTLLSLLVVFAGIAVTVAASALSHLVRKAAELQEQNDLTI